MVVASLEILADHIRYNRPEESMQSLVPLFISGNKRHEMPAYAFP